MSPSRTNSSAGRLDGATFCSEAREAPGVRTHDLPFLRRQTPAHELEQRRLADAVAADDARLVAGVHRQVQAVEQKPVTAVQRDVDELKHRI